MVLRGAYGAEWQRRGYAAERAGTVAGRFSMIASVFRVPAGSPAADPRRVEEVAQTPGLAHLYLLTPANPNEDRLSVLFWEKEEFLDRYIESDLGQQVLQANPNATRTVYTVEQVR